MPNGGYKVGYASDTCVVESPYSGWLSLVSLVAGLHEILHGQKDLEDSSSRYGVAQVLQRVVFLRRVVALCFPLFCWVRFLLRRAQSIRSKTNIKQIITKRQAVYAEAVCACEMAS